MEYKGQQLSSMKQAQKGEAGVGRIPKAISRGTLLHIRGCSLAYGTGDGINQLKTSTTSSCCSGITQPKTAGLGSVFPFQIHA